MLSDSISSLASILDPFSYFAKFVSDTEPFEVSQQRDWITDLELMHHYATVTSLGLPRAEELPELWQIETPRTAISHAYLMHQILALAGYHLAHLNPDDALVHSLQASQHQNAAVRDMRADLARIDTHNAHALFIASSLLLFSAFAAFAKPRGGWNPDGDCRRGGASSGSGSGPATIDDLLDIFLLARGVAGVLKSCEDTIRQGRFGVLMVSNVTASGFCKTSPTLDHVRDGSAALRNALDSSGPEVIDPAARLAAQNALKGLFSCTRDAQAFAASPEFRSAAVWPMELEDGFIVRLRRREVTALVVLAHYCVVLNATEEFCWFTRGWSATVLDDVVKSIRRSGGGWEEAIAWPLSVVKGSEREMPGPFASIASC